MSLHLSSMIPDRSLEESEMIKAITKYAIYLAKLRDQPVQSRVPALDVVFLLPSSQEKPDFQGLRLHSFDRAVQTIRIECSVPEKMVNSIYADHFVIAIIQDAIDAANEFFTAERILFDALGHQSLVELIAPKQHYAVN